MTADRLAAAVSLDCGCYILSSGHRVWCPSCLNPPPASPLIAAAPDLLAALESAPEPPSLKVFLNAMAGDETGRRLVVTYLHESQGWGKVRAAALAKVRP